MAKRKYPKLPNGFGTVKRLSGNRTNSFGVYPPVTAFRENGTPEPQKALAYVNDWLKGVGVLTAYHNGAYIPGQELPDYLDCSRQSDLVKGIIADYNAMRRINRANPHQKTFKEVYNDFLEWKYELDKSKTYSQNSITSTKTAFKHLECLHDRDFSSLRHADLQFALDSSPYRHASIELMKNLIRQMYQYAIIYEIIDSRGDYSQHLKINIPDDDEKGIPFSDDELSILWKNSSDKYIGMILIMCYSGYRISAYKNIEVNLDDNFFKGGVKTASSKDRIVPIHSAILPLVKRELKDNGCLLDIPAQKFRNQVYDALNKCGIEKHTPHDCRHTFSRLCEKYDVNENDRKRMLGHSFGNDITNRVYGHRTIEELRAQIERIQVCH